MKYLAQILALVEAGTNVQEQLNNILKFVLKQLHLTNGYVSGVYKKKSLISDSNPEGHSLKIITSIGETTKREDKFDKEPRKSIDHFTVPIQYKGIQLGQVCLIGIVDQTAVDEMKTIFWLMGMLMYYDKINEECNNLLEEKRFRELKICSWQMYHTRSARHSTLYSGASIISQNSIYPALVKKSLK